MSYGTSLSIILSPNWGSWLDIGITCNQCLGFIQHRSNALEDGMWKRKAAVTYLDMLPQDHCMLPAFCLPSDIKRFQLRQTELSGVKIHAA